MQSTISKALAEVQQLTAAVRANNGVAGPCDMRIDAMCDAIDRLTAVSLVLANAQASWPIDVPPSAWVSPSSGPEVQP